MDPSSKRAWIGSVLLSGTLLANSLPGDYSPGNPTDSVAGSVSISLKNSSGFSAQTVRYKILSIGAKYTKSDPLVQPTLATLATKAETSEERVYLAKGRATAAKERIKMAVALSSEISRGGPSQAEELVHNAQRLIGIPYVFGGTSTKGFDCSGFTQYVYKGSGIKLPRSSYAQYNIGTAVKKNQLQLGDLVFFSTYDQGASHVGIYIGGGSFIHAANSGITITSLSDNYYASRYLGARRIL